MTVSRATVRYKKTLDYSLVSGHEHTFTGLADGITTYFLILRLDVNIDMAAVVMMNLV
jgi:hypothetical protein